MPNKKMSPGKMKAMTGKTTRKRKDVIPLVGARPTGLTRQSKAKTMTYSPGKRKAINDFTTGRPNISTSKINTILSSKINKPGGMGMGTKSKSNKPSGRINLDDISRAVKNMNKAKK